MSEHLLAQQIERNKRRTMSPAELLCASDHLVTCDACRQMVNDATEVQATGALLRAELQAEARTGPTHLHYDQLEAYVDETVDDLDREIVESHLELCPSCAADAEDLRVFKAQIGAYPGPAAQTDRHSWSPVAFRTQSFYRISLQFAAAAALILLLVWAATLPLKRRVADLQSKLNEAQQKNDELEKQSTEIAALQAKLSDLQKANAQNASRQNTHALDDGGRLVTVDTEGNLVGMESIPQEIQQAVRGALTAPRTELPADVRGLRGRTGTLLGGTGEGVSIALIGPIGRVVETNRPTFRWRALSGAVSYVIDVFDSSLKRVATSAGLSATEWTPSQPLERGKIYSWQVTAMRDGKEITSPVPPAPEARFKVLDRSMADELGRAKKSYPDSHLILGALYEKAGLLDDAEREFKSLLSGNPNSPLAQNLLRGVKTLR